MVVYDDDAGACLDQPVEHGDQGGHVESMQAGGRLLDSSHCPPQIAELYCERRATSIMSGVGCD